MRSFLSFLQVVKTPYAKTPRRTQCEITESKTYLEKRQKKIMDMLLYYEN